MSTEKNLNNLVINKVESQDVYNYMKANSLINADELYLVEGDNEITITEATETESGLMSASDKVKLNGIEDGANKTIVDSTLSSTSGNPVQNKVINSKFDEIKASIDSKVPSTRTVNGKKLSSNITLNASDVGALPDTTVIPSIKGLATETYVDNKVSGLINSAPEALDTLNELATALGNDPNFATTIATQIGGKVDKINGKGLSTNDYTTAEKNKLASIDESAEVNQNAFSNVIIGATTIAADNKTDSLTFVAGNNVTLTPDAANDKITISAIDTTYGEAGTNLGLVKSGGDVTISSGIITVKDDSHNHIISNIDGLQDQLDSKVNSITGKGLSTNDYTTKEKTKLSGIAEGADVSTIKSISKNGTALSIDSSKNVNIEVPIKVSQLSNDSGYLTKHQDISGKADKATTLSGYGITDAKISSGIITLGSNTITPVTSVNGKSGASVTLDKTNIGLGNVDNVKQYSASNPPPYPVTSVNGKTGRVGLTAQDVGALPSDTVIPSVPDNIVKYTAISNVEATTPLDADSLQGHAADYFATATGLASVNSKVSTMQSDITTAKTNITNLKTDVTNLKNNKMNISGGTMTGALIAQNNTNYTTKQVRNIFISTSDPSGGDNGDIWIKYAE